MKYIFVNNLHSSFILENLHPHLFLCGWCGSLTATEVYFTYHIHKVVDTSAGYEIIFEREAARSQENIIFALL